MQIVRQKDEENLFVSGKNLKPFKELNAPAAFKSL